MRRAQIVALLCILSVALALRALYLISALGTPGYTWGDPDGYMAQALRLARDGWRWTFDAVTYTIEHQKHALPPMYPVFLSVFALFPGFPVTALVAQLILAVAATFLVFALGRRLHTPGAGLIAAAGYAIWVPNIFGVWSTSQETIYLPLVLLALLLMSRAMQRDAGAAAFGLAGGVFGVAALTRSMPLFFVLPAACAHMMLAANRRRASWQGAALLAGFLLITVPYSAALSRHFGQLTVIDTHGSIHLDVESGTRAPGPIETARALAGTIAARPRHYFLGTLELARTLFHVNGGRILQIYVVARDRASAAIWKILVHAGTDALLILAALVAPFGAVLARSRPMAVLFLTWTGVNIAITVLGGFGGARLRMPFEPLLIILASVVCAGRWCRPSRMVFFAALAVSLLAAAATLPQLPRTFRSWPDYGVEWPSIFDRRSGVFVGRAGLNVLTLHDVAVLNATAAGESPRVDVRARGVHVRSVQLVAGEPSPIRVLWPGGGLVYIELEARNPSTVPIRLDVPVP